MNRIEMVDQFIDERGGTGQMFVADDLAWWMEKRQGIVGGLRPLATAMLQEHCKSHQGPKPAKYVLDRRGNGRGAYWSPMEPADAIEAREYAVEEMIDRLNNLLARRGDAIAKRDTEMVGVYQPGRDEVRFALRVLKAAGRIA